eukprot:SAG25_NODE_29_length_20738_cov_25.829546_5_plen_84_part_00
MVLHIMQPQMRLHNYGWCFLDVTAFFYRLRLRRLLQDLRPFSGLAPWISPAIPYMMMPVYTHKWDPTAVSLLPAWFVLATWRR